MSGVSRTARRFHFEEIETDQPLPGVIRRQLQGEHMVVSQVELARGTVVDRHRHASEQFTLVIRGRIRFLFGDEGDAGAKETVATGGDVVHLPSDVVHGAVALEDSLVLDILAPPGSSSGLDQNQGASEKAD